MAKDTDVDNLAENAIDKVGTILDEIMLVRRNKEIKWDNLDIEKQSDFLKGYLLAEILFEFARQFHTLNKKNPSRLEFLEACKIIMNRADDIRKAITDSINNTSF